MRTGIRRWSRRASGSVKSAAFATAKGWRRRPAYPMARFAVVAGRKLAYGGRIRGAGHACRVRFGHGSCRCRSRCIRSAALPAASPSTRRGSPGSSSRSSRRCRCSGSASPASPPPGSRPEYSHGPVIPLLSFYMFLREMRDVPPATGPVTDRWPGVVVDRASPSRSRALGNLVQIDDIVFYALIVWIGGLVLTLLRRPPRLRLLALGAAPRLHAAAAAVPLLAAQHRAAVRLLRDRGLASSG